MAQSNPLKSINKGTKKTKSSRRGGKIQPKTMAIGLVSVFVLLLAFLFLTPANTTQAETPTEAQADTFYSSNKKEKKISPQKKADAKDLWSINYEKEAEPWLPGSVTSQLIDHKAYRTSYNAEYKIPNWTFYELTLAETLGRLPRSNNFQPDPAVPSRESAQLTDYRGSGYDRGHMAPSMDFNWDAEIEDESYLLSNMCPQSHDFNSGIWLDLEHQVRRWAERDSAICVACGPILPRKEKDGRLINPVTGKEYRMKYIGRGKVLVPEHFFKVILSPFGDHPKAIGFIMPNENVMRRDGRGNAPIKDFAVNIDRVEELTGIDFFAVLPDKIENKIEARYEYNDWFGRAKK